MTKVLVFDMDGTIANLYGVENWLTDLRAYNPRPYEVATPIYDMDTLASVLGLLRTKGWKVVVTSWLSMETTLEYDRMVCKAKREWLKKYNFPCDEVHLVDYGTPKAKCTAHFGGVQILVDDNAEVRKEWESNPNRFSIDATKNIMDYLVDLVIGEFENQGLTKSAPHDIINYKLKKGIDYYGKCGINKL